jgi:hypothetical protein
MPEIDFGKEIKHAPDFFGDVIPVDKTSELEQPQTINWVYGAPPELLP